MKLVSRTFAVLMLFGLWGCLGVDLKMPLPDVKSLSKLADMANPVERKIEWQSPLLQQHHLVGRIWRPIDGRFVDEDTLVEDLVRSAFILLGEKHDNPDHHLLQAELIEELTDEGRRPAVVWEMISETRQPILDRFHAELSDDTAALGAALGWDVSGWPAWALYEPIAEAAMEDKLPMYGGGLPKLVVRALARGRPSFEFARRRRILGLHVPMAKELRARSMDNYSRVIVN